MKIGIYGAGDFCQQADRTIPYIGVDGGIRSLQRLGITPAYIIGDFDSYDASAISKNIASIHLPCHKDYTDTEVAIMEAEKMGYDEIELYGVTGGRLDHFFAIARQLVKYRHLHITVHNDQNILYLLGSGKHCISKKNYTYLSFFAIQPSTISICHVAYPLDHYHLAYEDALCVSNEIIGCEAEAEIDGLVFCLQSNNREAGK